MYSNSRKNIIYPVLIAAAVVLGVFAGMSLRQRNNNAGMGVDINRLGGKAYADNKLVTALSIIDQAYVDQVDIDTLAETALTSLLESLDPHSVYIPAEGYAAANEVLDGEIEGVGILFNMPDDTVIVMTVIPGGPSDKAGVKNGDRIMMINDSIVAGKEIDQDSIVKLFRGKRNTQVGISLKREGIPDLVPVEITRDKVMLKSLDAAFMIKPGIGFVKLSAFSKNSIEELDAALQRLTAEGMESLIFDLRGNSGGFLDQAIAIANEFLPPNTMIVYTEDRFKSRTTEYSNGSGNYQQLKLALLVDEGTASSSEIVAGAIQDNDRGTVIGRRTFGKGLVQQQIPFNDGSAIRLTIARYYTPTGRSIQKPYHNGGGEEYREELYNRISHNELFSADSIKFADSLKFTTPGGRTVYGGGGIMPDIFVPVDTSYMTPYYVQATGRNIVYTFAINYTDRYRAKINAIGSVGELNAFFDSDRNLWSEFTAYAARNGITGYEGADKAKPALMALIRSYVGRNTPLEDVGFYSNIYVIDNDILTAIEELE